VHKQLATIGAVAIATVTLAGCASNSHQQPSASPSATTQTGTAPSITTQATAIVTGTPDEMQVVLGVQTSAATANGALNTNNTNANALLATLKSRGVAAPDLQTSGLSIQPNYNAKSVITGYQVSNTVTATLRHLTTAGSIIDAATSAAGDSARIQQISFSISDDTDLLAQARAKAVQQAQAQSGQIAKAAGSQLAGIRSITETPPSGQNNSEVFGDAAAAQSAAPTPIEAGSEQLSVSVTVSYNIS
jgi:uncharacterized protein YggE